MDRGIFGPILLNVNGNISCFMCGRIPRATAQDFSKPINIAGLGAIDQWTIGVVEFSTDIFCPLNNAIFADFDDGIFNNVTTSIETTTFEHGNDPSLGSEYAIMHAAFV